MSAAPPEPGWRRQGRAALIALHLLAITLTGFPAPTGAKSDKVWKDPALVSQIAGWVGPARALGLAEDAEQLTARLKAITAVTLRLRSRLVAPWEPYGKLFGTWQGWHMFGSVNPDPARLRVQLQDDPDAAWRTIYLARDPEADWQRRLLDSERCRAIVNEWSWGHDRADYRSFAAWLGRLAAADFPEASALRVNMIVGHIPEPVELRAGKPWSERARWEEIVPLRGRL